MTRRLFFLFHRLGLFACGTGPLKTPSTHSVPRGNPLRDVTEIMVAINLYFSGCKLWKVPIYIDRMSAIMPCPHPEIYEIWGLQSTPYRQSIRLIPK